MGKVRIVTDSSAQFIDPEIISRYGIEVVPLTIQVGAQSYLEGIDIDSESFFRMEQRDAPSVALIPPPVEAFETLYARLNRETDQVLSLHISGEMSRTWHNAMTASKSLMGRCDIIPVDSLTTSVGLALVVEEAAKAAESGAELEEVVRIVRGMLEHVYSVFYVDSLDYLKHNGLLSEAQSILGTMLNIKPFLTIEEGELIPMEKVRTQAQAVDRLIEFVTEFGRLEKLIVLQNTPYATDTTRMLQERLALEYDGQTFPTAMYGPSLATLIGPHGTGIVVLESPEIEDDD